MTDWIKVTEIRGKPAKILYNTVQDSGIIWYKRKGNVLEIYTDKTQISCPERWE